MFKERMITTGILAVALLALIGFLRPDSIDPQENVLTAKTEFFMRKAHSEQTFDMIIVGDSRALRGLSPEILEEENPGFSIFNLAFNAGGMNTEMFQLAESHIKPESPTPAILLVPTSLSFLPHKKGNSQYREYKNKPRDLVWLYMKHPQWAHFFQPLSPSVFPRNWWNIEPKEMLYQDFHHSGWIATHQVPFDDVTHFGKQIKILSGMEVDRGLVESFMDQTRDWTRSGIKVFGMLPPAYAPRVAAEDSTIGFDRIAFKDSFIEAGGIWLESNDLDLVTYDGSHLIKESSVLLSRKIGKDISRAWN